MKKMCIKGEAAYWFRGISLLSMQWVYGGFFYDEQDNKFNILTSCGTFVPIVPTSLGFKTNFFDLELYHGDILMTAKDEINGNNVDETLDSIFQIHGQILMQYKNSVIVASDKFSCVTELEELDRKNTVHIGNIFSLGLDFSKSRLYSPLPPIRFKGNTLFSYGRTGGYFYDTINGSHFFVYLKDNGQPEADEIHCLDVIRQRD